MKKVYLFSIIIALVTGIAVFLFASELQQNSKAKYGNTPMVSVVVAASDIAQNTTITAEMLATALFPKDSAPVSALTDINKAVGKISKHPILKQEQILSEKIFDAADAENKKLAARVKDGYRAFTISVDNITGMSGYLMIGDKIDLIITKTVKGTPTTSYLMQNIKIIAIGNASQYTVGVTNLMDYSSITLEIPAKDCPMLTYNIVNGLVKVVLRGIEDDKMLTVPEVKN